MSKKKIIALVIFSVLLIAIVPTITASYNSSVSSKEKEIIANTFNSIQNEINQDLKNKNIAIGKGFDITYERFIFYKKNIEMVNALSKMTNYLTDEELLNNLLTKDFAIQEAKNLGITVTKSEIEESIKFQKELLNNPEIKGDSKELVQEIMKKRIEITGLTEDEFWESDIVKNGYEDALYLDKLYSQLLSIGEVENMEEFSNYQDNLFNLHKKSVEINYDVLSIK